MASVSDIRAKIIKQLVQFVLYMTSEIVIFNILKLKSKIAEFTGLNSQSSSLSLFPGRISNVP